MFYYTMGLKFLHHVAGGLLGLVMSITAGAQEIKSFHSDNRTVEAERINLEGRLGGKVNIWREVDENKDIRGRGLCFSNIA